jgi:glycopeptide antibiotics resistance protein
MNKGFKQTVVIVIGISVSIEVVQYILAIGISDIDDVILFTAGAIVGIFAILTTETRLFQITPVTIFYPQYLVRISIEITILQCGVQMVNAWIRS